MAASVKRYSSTTILCCCMRVHAGQSQVTGSGAALQAAPVDVVHALHDAHQQVECKVCDCAPASTQGPVEACSDPCWPSRDPAEGKVRTVLQQGQGSVKSSKIGPGTQLGRLAAAAVMLNRGYRLLPQAVAGFSSYTGSTSTKRSTGDSDCRQIIQRLLVKELYILQLFRDLGQPVSHRASSAVT